MTGGDASSGLKAPDTSSFTYFSLEKLYTQLTNYSSLALLTFNQFVLPEFYTNNQGQVGSKGEMLKQTKRNVKK